MQAARRRPPTRSPARTPLSPAPPDANPSRFPSEPRAPSRQPISVSIGTLRPFPPTHLGFHGNLTSPSRQPISVSIGISRPSRQPISVSMETRCPPAPFRCHGNPHISPAHRRGSSNGNRRGPRDLPLVPMETSPPSRHPPSFRWKPRPPSRHPHRSDGNLARAALKGAARRSLEPLGSLARA